MQDKTNTAPRVERFNQVCERTCLSASSIRRRMASGTFPQPFPLGGRAIGWLSSDIDQWIEDMAASVKGEPA